MDDDKNPYAPPTESNNPPKAASLAKGHRRIQVGRFIGAVGGTITAVIVDLNHGSVSIFLASMSVSAFVSAFISGKMFGSPIASVYLGFFALSALVLPVGWPHITPSALGASLSLVIFGAMIGAIVRQRIQIVRIMRVWIVKRLGELRNVLRFEHSF